MIANVSVKTGMVAVLLSWTVLVSGCSSTSTSPPATSGAATGQSAAAPSADTESDAETGAAAPMPAGQSAVAKFPPADVTAFRTIVTDTLAKVQAGDQPGAIVRITDLETAWDDAQDRLEPMDPTGWESLDRKIDNALKAVRSTAPDPTAEKQSLNELLSALQ
jgi:uncharacterized protein YceK